MLENKDTSKTDLEQLGEFGLIRHLTQYLTIKQPSTLMGIGDDAALLQFDGKELAVTTDMLVEGVHFDLGYTPLKHLGYKSVVVNLSDIYAMGMEPAQITVSVAVSNRFTLEALEELYSGIALASNIYGIDVVGGDTTSSNKGLILSITAIGHGHPGSAVKRSGAAPNDLLVVSGDLGAAYMGLQVLRREQEVFKVNPSHQPDLARESTRTTPRSSRGGCLPLRRTAPEPSVTGAFRDAIQRSSREQCRGRTHRSWRRGQTE